MALLGTDLSTALGTALGRDLSDASVLTQLGAKLWFTPETGYYTTATGVNTLTDKIGGYVVSQGTGPQQPTRNATSNFASGRPSLTFSAASSQVLTGTVLGLSANGPLTAAMSLRRAATGVNDVVFAWGVDSTNKSGFWVNSSNQVRHQYRDTSTSVQTADLVTQFSATADAWAVITYDGSNTIRVETPFGAESTATGASAVSFAATSLALGSMFGTSYASFEMLDFVAFDRDLGASGSHDRNLLQGWLEARMAA